MSVNCNVLSHSVLSCDILVTFISRQCLNQRTSIEMKIRIFWFPYLDWSIIYYIGKDFWLSLNTYSINLKYDVLFSNICFHWHTSNISLFISIYLELSDNCWQLSCAFMYCNFHLFGYIKLNYLLIGTKGYSCL